MHLKHAMLLFPALAVLSCGTVNHRTASSDNGYRGAIPTQRKTHPEELEIALGKIWLPRVILEDVSWRDALALGISRARESGNIRPFDFHVKVVDSIEHDTKVTVDADTINFLNYLDIICYQAGLVWCVKDHELTIRSRDSRDHNQME